VVLLETRHVKAALSAMVVKTDRKDARGIAQLIRILRRAFANSSPVRELVANHPMLQVPLSDLQATKQVSAIANEQVTTPNRKVLCAVG